MPALICAIAVASSSCTFQTYEGRSRPASEVAIVRTTSGPLFLGYESVTIQSVDEDWFPALASHAEILPGPHYISVGYDGATIGATYRSVRSCVIEFEARAGETYVVRYDTDDANLTWGAWLENTATKARIAECTWRALGTDLRNRLDDPATPR